MIKVIKDPKALLCGLQLSVFTVIEFKTEFKKILIYLKKRKHFAF